MAVTVFTLCERALGLCRGKRLILTDPQKIMLEALNYTWLADSNAQDEALACARHFEFVQNSLLETYPWVFARNYGILTDPVPFSMGAWRYGYILPSYCKKLHALMTRWRTSVDYELIGHWVGCDYEEVFAIYTSDTSQTAIGAWPALFCDAFCARLASEICIAVTGDPNAGNNLFQMFQFAISEGYRTGIIDSGLRLDNQLTDASKSTKEIFFPSPSFPGGDR
jgi:hypothetical protein